MRMLLPFPGKEEALQCGFRRQERAVLRHRQVIERVILVQLDHHGGKVPAVGEATLLEIAQQLGAEGAASQAV